MARCFYPHLQPLVAYGALLLLLLQCHLLLGSFFSSFSTQADPIYEMEDLSRNRGIFGVEHYVPSPYGYLPSRYQKNHPVCPVVYRPVWREAVVQQAWPSIVTVVKPMALTRWHTYTETIRYPVTVVSRSTVVLNRDVFVKTNTVCVPKLVTIVKPQIQTAMRTISKTFMQILTVTMTNYWTTTAFVPHRVTVSQIRSVLHTRYVPTTEYATVWSSKVVTVTQPVYVTTELLVKAPELRVVTSTSTVPHYVTATKLVTIVAQKTVCQQQY